MSAKRHIGEISNADRQLGPSLHNLPASLRLVILDRDGVLNEPRPDDVKTPEELVLLPGAVEAVARLHRAGIAVALCTNQDAVARGVMTAAMVDRVHDRLCEELNRGGGRLEAIYFCPDLPNCGSAERKPAPGMLLKALERLQVAPHDALMIGDELADLEAAAQASCHRILVRTGEGAATEARGLPDRVRPVWVFDDIDRAVTALVDASVTAE